MHRAVMNVEGRTVPKVKTQIGVEVGVSMEAQTHRTLIQESGGSAPFEN